MKTHGKFLLISLAGLLAPLVLGFSALGPFLKQFEHDGFHTVQERRVRAHAQTLDRPKILFIGGSSTFMAIDPEAYSASLGRPVINYGLTVHDGAQYIARQASELIQPGDLVVFSAEFIFFGFSAPPGADPPPRPAQRTPRQPRQLPWWRLAKATANARMLLAQIEQPMRALLHQSIFGLPHPFRPRLNHYETFLLTPTGSFRHTRPGRFEDERFFTHGRPSLTDVDIVQSAGGHALNWLASACAKRDAVFAVMPPARVVRPENRHDIVKDIERDWLRYARELGAFVLLDAGETTLDIEFGFDSDYHMNDAGAKMIHQRLVPALERALSKTKTR